MTCSEVEARFIDVLDERVEPAASVRVHAHIESCADCRSRAALWRKLAPALRAIEPLPLAPAAVRRMQLDVERLVAWEEAPARPTRAPRFWRPALFGLVGAAAVVAFWIHASRRPGPTAASDASTAFAAVSSARGSPTADGRPIAASGHISSGSEIALGRDSEVEIGLARGARLRLAGPARLVLGGTARDVSVDLEEGTVEAEVAHRLPGESFAVRTRDLRVEVRGTKFSVGVGASGSWIHVAEGRVAVRFSDGRETSVSSGESAQSTTRQVAPATAPSAPPAGCGSTVRTCESTTRAVRQSMRGGDAERALRLVAAGTRATHEADGDCGDGLAACEDELRYLRAEALHQAGRLDDAIGAYRALDRRGAPAATRQNALYAAAQIEERRGLGLAARADYERALAAAPRGALGEEALVGAMESAQAAGDPAGARLLAQRYLDQFPHGLKVAVARRLAVAGARH